MRIAVPLYGSAVAPRFCSADRALLVEARAGPREDARGDDARREDARDEDTREVDLGPGGIPRRLLRLQALGVDRLLCGGFNRRFLPYADALGVRVSWGYLGEAREAVAAFLEGRPPPAPPPSPAGTGRARTSGTPRPRRPGRPRPARRAPTPRPAVRSSRGPAAGSAAASASASAAGAGPDAARAAGWAAGTGSGATADGRAPDR